jgi:hypothetical protein
MNGSEELLKHLGFIDVSVSYDNMVRFIRSASIEVRELIGTATYNVIIGYYEGATTDEQMPYVDAMQDAVAVQAYRQYVPSKDVAHTQNGRRMRMDDHEKQAFEWMLDRDNENLERMYYQALDQLLIILDALPSWKETNEYKALNSLFVSKTADFQQYFDINNSRLLMMKLQPGLRQCEQLQILPRLGKTAYDALKEDSTDKERLLELVKSACVYWSLQWAFSGRLTVTLFPEGVLQRYVGERNTTQSKMPATMNEYAWAAQQFRHDAEDILIQIENEVAPPYVPTEGDDEKLGFGFKDTDGFVTT